MEGCGYGQTEGRPAGGNTGNDSAICPAGASGFGPRKIGFRAAAGAMLALCLLPTGARALEVSEIPESHAIPHLREAPRIDGTLADWDPEQVFVLELDPDTRPPSEHHVTVDHPFRGAEDASARVMLAWDREHLYVGARVRDDFLRGIAAGTAHNEGPNGWACDGLMLNLHSFRQPIQRPGYHGPLALRCIIPADGRGEPAEYRAQPDERWLLTPRTRFASRETDDGYELEAAIPWADLEFQAAPGEPLYIGFMLVDVDPGESLKQLGWSFSGRQKFRLTDGSGALGLLTVARDRLAAAQEPQAARYQVDALADNVRVEALRITGPDGLDRSETIGTPVPAGQRAQDVVVFRDLPAVVGPATIRLEASIDGHPVTLAEAPFAMIAARPDPPRVSNPLGEIVRQPPERTYHHAQAERRRNRIRYGYIHDRSGYERYLMNHVRQSLEHNFAVHAEHLTREKGHIWAASHVLPALALYRLTGEPQYAEWTKLFVEGQLRHLETETDAMQRLNRMSSLIWPRYFIWQHDSASDLAPPDAEARYASLWAGLAADPPDWLFHEWGYHNRTWHRWRDARLMIHFADRLELPVDPRVREYAAWHDRHLVPFGDSTDNSSGYNWSSPGYYLSVHAALDTFDEALRNERFLSTLQRLRDYIAPMGVLPNWGDTSGWMTGGSSAVSMGELLSRLTRDGSFRYVGHRTAEYFYNFMWSDPNQYHMVQDSVAGAFVAAWLHADDSVAPRAPSGASLITRAHRTVDLTPEEQNARPGLAFGRLTEEQIADKAVLKSGNDPYGLWAFVELRETGGHAGILPGNIATLLAHGAALYAGQGYWDTGQGDNNVVWVEDLEGVSGAGAPVRVEVPAFADDPALTWLRVRALQYGGLPITATRDILFVKNGALVVRDKLEFHAAMKLRFGPCWHARNLGPQCGEDWFNTWYGGLYSTGLGVGRGVHVFPNPPWDLLVAFAPRQDCVIEVADRYDENPWRVSPVRMRQSWSGIVNVGEIRTFVSVLLPHVPSFDVTPFREHIAFRVDREEALLVRLPRTADARNPLQGNHYTLQLCDGEAVQHADWHSDARVAFVERRPDGTLQQALLIEGERLTADGQELSGQARRPAVQVVQRLAETD